MDLDLRIAQRHERLRVARVVRLYHPSKELDPVLMPLAVFRHVISGLLSLAFVVHTCRALRRDFSATLTTPALDRRSSRWFGASPCRAAPEGQASISCTAPLPVIWSSTSS